MRPQIQIKSKGAGFPPRACGNDELRAKPKLDSSLRWNDEQARQRVKNFNTKFANFPYGGLSTFMLLKRA